MDEAEFCSRLEHRISFELTGFEDPHVRGLASDGVVLTGRVGDCLVGWSWMLGITLHPRWDVEIVLPPGDWELADLLPPRDVTGWLVADPVRGFFQVDPAAAVPDAGSFEACE